MMNYKTTWLLVGVLCLVVWLAYTQDTLWEKYNDAGVKAYEQGDYTEAEK